MGRGTVAETVKGHKECETENRGGRQVLGSLVSPDLGLKSWPRGIMCERMCVYVRGEGGTAVCVGGHSRHREQCVKAWRPEALNSVSMLVFLVHDAQGG